MAHSDIKKVREMFSFDWSKRTHKGLRRWILYLVRDNPKSGVEIMDIMESNLQGWWRPSPGSIYPLLDRMMNEGLLTQSKDKKYSLTDKGREEIDRPFGFLSTAPASAPRSVEGVVSELSSYVSYLEDVAVVKDGRLKASAGQIKELSERMQKLSEDS
jgi:DNA-binding PadR family transcriptional regulator